MTKSPRRTAQSKQAKALTGAGFGQREFQALGQEVRGLRESRGWSLKRTASESGVSVAAIQNIEGGSANPSLVTVLRLAEVFGQPLDQLVSASREAAKVVKIIHGEFPRAAEGIVGLSGALANPSMAAQVVSIPANGEIDDLPLKPPFFAYLLEGSVVITFDDGQIERLQPQDAMHVFDRFPNRLTNPLARRSVLLCLSDLRSQQPNNGGGSLA